MTDREVIMRKINSIQNCLQRIVEKTQHNLRWTENYDLRDVVDLNLVRAVQLCVDIAGSIITEKKWGLPSTLADSFVILEKNHVIDRSLMLKMQKMVGFRNVSTHAYKEINYEIVKSIVENHLRDFEDFYTVIINYIDQQS